MKKNFELVKRIEKQQIAKWVKKDVPNGHPNKKKMFLVMGKQKG